MNPCRVLLDPPASGAWNMAVDEALLQHTRTGGMPVFRLYEWHEATLSLGYFQSCTDAVRFAGLPWVRRLSGGGAIVHHNEITYSLCLPPKHALGKQPNRLYRQVHEGISNALAALKANVECRGTAGGKARKSTSEPFLCFLRRNEDDLGLAAQQPRADGLFRKIVGSAQRRRRGSLLQHGSLIVASSPFVPELVGLREAAGVEVELCALKQKLFQAVVLSLGLRADHSQLETPERDLAARFVDEKYANRDWTCRR